MPQLTTKRTCLTCGSTLTDRKRRCPPCWLMNKVAIAEQVKTRVAIKKIEQSYKKPTVYENLTSALNLALLLSL